ncbi:MAG: triose-phosphate isomerase [Flavobacteriaceae bacterium TMED184]|nr:MAG: triose-phosphate isomerase [Flavobacteriaceae bacterium TMED184]
MRKKIAAGNWKMNTTLNEGLKLASQVVHMSQDESLSDMIIIISVPYTHIESIKKTIVDTKNVFISAQNCHQKVSGAYTGEISAGMLQNLGVDYVIIGHSERREYFKETYDELETKTRIVLNNQMTPIFCCGESLPIREENGHFKFIKKQLSSSLFGLNAVDLAKLIIAYEPVWAIGTGVTASDIQAQEMHHFIRHTIAEKYGEIVAKHIPILYGGSVKPANAQTLFACPDVDGGLIGGASLDAQGFIEIAKSF